MKEKIRAMTVSTFILTSDLLNVLSHDGGLGDFEARRVV